MKKIPVLTLSVFLFSTSLMAGISTTLFEKDYEGCGVKVVHDAVAGEKGTILLRGRTEKHSYCPISRSQVEEVLGAGLKKLHIQPELSRVESIFIGRLESYPWIREFLVRQSKNSKKWNMKKVRPVSGSNNSFVNSLLDSKTLLKPFSVVLEKSGYRVAGVSCEKILINKDKLPYDAMCWIKIK